MREIITTATDVQAEVAIQINRQSVEVAKLLSSIEDYASKAQKKQSDTISISLDARSIASEAAKLAEANAKLDSMIEMGNVIGLTPEIFEVACTPVAVWFTSEESK